MFVVKRGGRKEAVNCDKITSRIQKLCYGLNMDFVDPVAIKSKVVKGLYNGVTTAELDSLAADVAATMSTNHADYAQLAARIVVSNLHKETKKQFSDVMHDLYHAKKPVLEEPAPLISEFHYNIIRTNSNRLNSEIIYDRDFSYSYFGFRTLERSCLLKINGKTVERPQHMLMRVAIGIHGSDIDAAIQTYKLLSENFMSHSISTLSGAATNNAQLASSYLVAMKDDSINGIYYSLKECGKLSATADVGFNVHCIRAKGSYIAGTNGISNGLVPLLRVYNNNALMFNTGETKSPVGVFVEPWHADVLDFLELGKSTGKDEIRATELSYGLWIPDLFMKRVESNGDWSLMCPHECPGLYNVWGDEFDILYLKYEAEGRFIRKMKAQDLWAAIVSSQTDTGAPFLLYKDTCNRKSNQQNAGTMRCSNVGTEILHNSSEQEPASCPSGVITLSKIVTKNRKFDFVKLKEIAKTLTHNLNKIIDSNAYSAPGAESVAKEKYRAIAIGVQGLADAFIIMRLPHESEAAHLLNQQIFETIYYGALEASCELAEKYGTYSSYKDSPVSKGILQYDMWNKTPTNLWDWQSLKSKIMSHGVRNSLLVAAGSTTATSHIIACNQSFEPLLSNIHFERVGSSDIKLVNHLLIKDLADLNLWTEDIKNKILSANGSIQAINVIPANIRELYKTVYELSVKNLMKMAADRGAFIDQSQSFNIYMNAPTYGKITSMHFYGWNLGLKTGLYRLQTTKDASPSRTPMMAKQITETTEEKRAKEKRLGDMVCSLENKDACLSCGS
ncbi:ribonucleoside-diphosphate reductase large subunit-like [Bradysia coprophila]|uniref:ribonucleoside-diphosphate reductase large subunit-like n=1 Tax=Bradysia coprophila TaxID=38358 RepID=UPI00187DD467|nr:ribonucleoside-diphosphate reductase large subunit-like [Bradysia coprophila]